MKNLDLWLFLRHTQKNQMIWETFLYGNDQLELKTAALQKHALTGDSPHLSPTYSKDFY